MTIEEGVASWSYTTAKTPSRKRRPSAERPRLGMSSTHTRYGLKQVAETCLDDLASFFDASAFALSSACAQGLTWTDNATTTPLTRSDAKKQGSPSCLADGMAGPLPTVASTISLLATISAAHFRRTNRRWRVHLSVGSDLGALESKDGKQQLPEPLCGLLLC